MIHASTVWILAAGIALPAYAQFELYIVNGSIELPAPPVYRLGSIYSNETATARFRLRNISKAPAAVYVLAADGAGFSISGAPPLPFGLDPQAALEFTVAFRAANIGSYSAALHSEGVSVLLIAEVLPRLTYTVEGQPIGPMDFGAIETGSSAVRHVSIGNLTSLTLTVPSISVDGSGFSLVGGSPVGLILQPRQSASFDVQFLPPGAGTFGGSLVIGDRTYALRGTGTGPVLPKPLLSVALGEPRSARQGTVTVTLDSAARSSGTGTLTLEFRPVAGDASDPGIVFLTGSRSIPFMVSPGDTQALIAPFQTGTTAGTLTFTASVGGNIDQQSFSIAGAPVGIASAGGSRRPGAIELLVTGFDNTRTAGAIAYTFFDTVGNRVAPGAIQVNSTAEFTMFFQSSAAGGNFLLRSTFPVTGDASKIVAFEIEFSNSAGASRTGRVTF